MSKILYWANFTAQTMADSMGITVEDAKSTNCNSLSHATECRVKVLCDGFRETSQKPWDVTETKNGNRKLEVRNMDKKISFAPSTATGKGRMFEMETFEKKLSSLGNEGIYVVADCRPFKYPEEYENPYIRFYQIPGTLVSGLYALGAIGNTAHIGSQKRKHYNKTYQSNMRFDELFPWDETSPFCGFDPNKNLINYPSAQVVLNRAVDAIEKQRTRG